MREEQVRSSNTIPKFVQLLNIISIFRSSCSEFPPAPRAAWSQPLLPLLGLAQRKKKEEEETRTMATDSRWETASSSPPRPLSGGLRSSLRRGRRSERPRSGAPGRRRTGETNGFFSFPFFSQNFILIFCRIPCFRSFWLRNSCYGGFVTVLGGGGSSLERVVAQHGAGLGQHSREGEQIP